MRKKVNPTMIGAFVLGAIVLVVGGILTFAGGRLFAERSVYVVFFDGSIKGLRVGAPVSSRGAPIGTVTAIDFIVNDDLSVDLPVTFEVPQGQSVREPDDIDTREGIQRMIQNGLRAKLETTSLVTGRVGIGLDYFPNTPIELQKDPTIDRKIIEIPTIRSDREELARAAGDIAEGIPELVRNANTLVTELVDFIRSEREAIGGTLQNVEGATASVYKNIDDIVADSAATMTNLRSASGRLDDVIGKAEGAMDEATTAIKDMRSIVEESRDNVGRTMASLEDSAKTVDAMLQENREALSDFVNVTLFDVSGLITDTQRLVNTLNRVGEDLERDPPRFLFGDRQQGFQGGQQ